MTPRKPQLADSAPDPKMGPTQARVGGTAVASENAPFIFFDLASAWGYCDGVGSITLEALRMMNSADGVRRDWGVTAHLRMGMGALLQLRDAINAVELMAQQSNAGPMN